jgi:hypothetical protein
MFWWALRAYRQEKRGVVYFKLDDDEPVSVRLVRVTDKDGRWMYRAEGLCGDKVMCASWSSDGVKALEDLAWRFPQFYGLDANYTTAERLENA